MKGLPRTSPAWRQVSQTQLDRLLEEQEVDEPAWLELTRLKRAYQTYANVRSKAPARAMRLIRRLRRRRDLSAIEVEAIRFAHDDWAGRYDSENVEKESAILSGDQGKS